MAGGLGYAFAYSAVLYVAAEPGSTRSTLAISAAVCLATFETGFLVWLIMRRIKMRRLWREAAQLSYQKQFAESREVLVQLLEFPEYKLNPASVLFALGVASEALGETRQAQRLYRRAGDYPPALQALGLLLLEQGINQRAAQVLRKAAARRPDDLPLATALAMALFRAGRVDAAVSTLESRLRRRPNSRLLKQNLERLEAGEEPSLQVAPANSGRATGD